MRAATTDTEAMMAICPLSRSSSRPTTDPLQGIHVFPVPSPPYRYEQLLFLKQIGMTAGSFKNNLLLLILIKRQPVRFNMAIPASLIVSRQFVVSTALRKLFLSDEQPDDFLYFFLSFPLFNILLRSRSNCLVYQGKAFKYPACQTYHQHYRTGSGSCRHRYP